MRDPDQAKHSARVYLNEARSRRRSAFFWTLMTWAANARRRAAQPQASTASPAQLDLFE